MNLNGVEYYYIRNAQGDIIGLFDKDGTQVVSYSYDSWGKLISIDGSLKDTVGVKNPYRYRGYRYDTETGLYYLQGRYYNPEWGRFINADGIAGKTGELLSHNMFAYAMNNPINFEDTSGFFPRPVMVSECERNIIVAVAVVVIVSYNNLHKAIGSLSDAVSSIGKSISNAVSYISKKGKNTSNLPNQGYLKGNVKGAPPVDAGKQGKHVIGHPAWKDLERRGEAKSPWPEGETGVDLTQEAWEKGEERGKDGTVKVWDAGRVIGPNGETKVNVKYSPSDGAIHGYPTH